jgi:hypothetical protein
MKGDIQQVWPVLGYTYAAFSKNNFVWLSFKCNAVYRLHVSSILVYSCIHTEVKVKCTPVQALRLCTGRMAYRGSRGIALLFLDHGIRRGEGSASRPSRCLPPGKTRYPLYKRLGGSQGRSGQVQKISPPPGFDPRTVQPIASHYTDRATWSTYIQRYSAFLFPLGRKSWESSLSYETIMQFICKTVLECITLFNISIIFI